MALEFKGRLFFLMFFIEMHKRLGQTSYLDIQEFEYFRRFAHHMVGTGFSQFGYGTEAP